MDGPTGFLRSDFIHEDRKPLSEWIEKHNRYAIKEAQKHQVSIYSFYAPTVGLTSWNHRAISYGQSSLNRLSNETGGRAFFQGTDFVTFDPYFDRLRQALNEQYARAY